MPDKFPPEQRSKIMSRVKQRDTAPEIIVRRLLHRMGYRFRLQRKDLPGNPDIVLPRHRKIVFIHGCFWHGHEGCRRAARPTSNTEFWNRKIDKNMARDARVIAELEKLGWQVLTVWQCQTKDTVALQARLTKFLESEQETS
jgi:DNA mismatch endonuclease (patch repair protein)